MVVYVYQCHSVLNLLNLFYSFLEGVKEEVPRGISSQGLRTLGQPAVPILWFDQAPRAGLRENLQLLTGVAAALAQ